MKGILLAGGMGTRLKPFTLFTSKHLLPIFDKPMIFYSLSILMLSKIKDILIIVNKNDFDDYNNILGNGEKYGININYAIQHQPTGIPEAFIIGEKFIGKDNVTLILGDNFFYGQDFTNKLLKAKKNHKGVTLFTYQVNDPTKFGVLEFDKNKIPKRIVEKPIKPKSNIAVTGLYIFDNKVISYSKKTKRSKRGELEISDVNNEYIKRKAVKTVELGRGYVWFDTGEFDKLLKASQFIKTMQDLQGIRIGCLEEISYNNKWINSAAIKRIIKNSSSPYEKLYLEKLLNDNE